MVTRARIRLLPLLTLLACKPAVMTTPPPADAPAAEVALTGASVLIGAGDIADCNAQGDELTAGIVDSVLRADSVAKVETVVFTTGDNAYPSGSAENFARCFTPSWGDSAKRIMKNIRPAPGNHEHLSSGGSPYYDYFGKSAGSPKLGYYSYTLGAWHVVALNSEMVVNDQFSPAERQTQLDWLAADLKSTAKKCIVAYWHHPRFSSGWHGSDPRLAAVWDALYAGGVDLVLNGHDHNYERFKPMSPAGVVDTARGIVEIIVGTGGGTLRGLKTPLSPNSVSQVQGIHGVLKLTLGALEWRSAFLAVTGRIFDSSGGRCH